MKLLLSTSLTLLAILPALCWPTGNDDMYRQSYDYNQPETEIESYLTEPRQGQYPQAQYNPFYYAKDQGQLLNTTYTDSKHLCPDQIQLKSPHCPRKMLMN